MAQTIHTRRGRVERWLNRVWYESAAGAALLIPLSLLYRAATGLRRALYAIRLLPSYSIASPVIVVGNVTAGGTGKTPFVIWLTSRLRDRGVHVAVVSRGYNARVGAEPLRVDPDSDAEITGDEPLLIAQRTGAPVFCHPNRVRAAQRAVEEGAEIVIADDGLQHLRLRRDIEIATIDGRRRFGNGRLLPAGPLRDPVRRHDKVDVVVCTGGTPEAGEIGMKLKLEFARRISDGESRPLSEFAGHSCHAVAGIANPERFFNALSELGIDVNGIAPGDHAKLDQEEIVFADGAPVLMTEKDAVRVRGIAMPVHWAVPVTAVIDPADAERIDAIVERTLARPGL